MIAILASLLLPALGSAKNRAQRVSCTNNLKQLGLGLLMYADDSGDKLPPTDFNPEKNPGSGPYQSYWMFDGPPGRPADLKNPHNLAYLYTSKLITTPKTFYDPGLRHPDLVLVRFEMKYYENAKYPWPKSDDQRESVRAKNPTGINTLWGDGHVSFSTSKRAFEPKLWDPGDDADSAQNPGDNPQKFRTIVSLLRP
jgi:prepilin-type processing-associated H-X9-DG protein